MDGWNLEYDRFLREWPIFAKGYVSFREGMGGMFPSSVSTFLAFSWRHTVS